jgi:WD40 repeat protein
MLPCGKCGHTNPEDAAFCGGCGAAPSAAPVAALAAAPPARRRFPWLVVAGAAVLAGVAVFAVGCVFIYLKYLKNPPDPGPGPGPAPATLKSLDAAIAEQMSDPQQIVFRRTWPDGPPEQARKALIVEDCRVHYLARDAEHGWRHVAVLATRSYSFEMKRDYNPTWVGLARNGQGGLIGFNQVGNISLEPYHLTEDGIGKGPPELSPEDVADLKEQLIAYFKESAPTLEPERRERIVNASLRLFFGDEGAPTRRPAARGAPNSAVNTKDSEAPAHSRWEEKGTLQHRGEVTDLAFSPDGKRLAAGVGGRDEFQIFESVVLWEPATGTKQYSLLGTQRQIGVYSVAFAPDGVLVVGDADGLIALWDPPGDEKPDFARWLMKVHHHRVSSLAFSRDGKTLVTASFDNTAKLWKVTGERSGTGTKKAYSLEGHKDKVFGVAFSPDGNLVATASGDGTVKLWDTATGKEKRTLAPGGGAVFSVAFAPDGNTLASGGADKIVRLWNLTTGQDAILLEGHVGGIRSLAFTLDGKTLASGSEDKTIKLWNVGRRQELITLPGHQGQVWAVAFSSDGATLASGGEDKTAKLWRRLEDH